MKPAGNIEKLVKKLRYQSSEHRRERIFDAVAAVLEDKQKTKPAVIRPNRWRIIMHSKMTKPIAAAIIIVAGLLSLTLSNKTVPSAYAITDVPRLFRQAKSIHVKGWKHYNLTDHELGEKVPPQPVERWIDLENCRYRVPRITVYAGPKKVKFVTTETITDGQYKMILNNANKSVNYYKLSTLQQKIELDERLNDLFYGHLFPSPEILKQFKKTEQEKINGILYDVWKCEIKKSSQRKNRYIYWLSTIDGSSGRFQSWYKNSDEPWRLGTDLDVIESNVEMPDNVFDLKVPEGYTALKTLENAPNQELGQQAPGFQMLRTRISFTLSDGSVILAWQSQDKRTHKAQDTFEKLEFGGDLPEAPIQISGLDPVGWIWEGSVTYTGYHLTSTVKSGNVINWSLYIPDNKPPKRKQILGYDVILKYSPDYEPEGTLQLMASYGISITSAEEFNQWVLGAMTELSDDGIAPAEITYETVTQLANKLRNEMVH